MRIETYSPRPVGALGCALALLLATASALAQEPPRRFPRDRPIDVTRIALELEVDLEGQAISGTARLSATALIAPLERVELDAVGLEISSVTDRADGRALVHRQTADKLIVDLASPIARRGEPLELVVSYRATPERGLHFFKPTSSEPDVPLQVWSQNESLEARLWIPCVDTPEERQASEIRAIAPKGFQVVSNGRLVSRELTPDGRVAWHYRQDFEHPAYLITLVVGEFHVARDEWDGVPLAYYVPPDRAADTERTFSTTKAMLGFFSELFGVRYPYSKYDQVVVEQFIFGGMENTGATTLNERTLHDERAHLDFRSDGLIAHELGHQWFGDLLTCRDWAHIWLNEGFASFSEACWDEHRNGRDAYLENMLAKANGARSGGLRAPLVRRRYNNASETFGGGTYPKGAWVLHMLREELGPEVFWMGIQRYLEAHRSQPVETEDFRQAMESVSARSLGRFFHQWTEREGHPVITAKVRWRADEKLLEVALRQSQKGDAFHLTLDVVVTEAGGARRTIPVRIEDKTARLLLPLGARPKSVGVDPELRVLAEVKLEAPRDMLIASLDSPSLVERVHAVQALRKDRHASVLKALAQRIKSDPSERVARDAVSALGGAPGEASRAALLDGLAWQRGGDPKTARHRANVRHAIVTALAPRHEEPGVAEALRALAADEPSYRVLASLASACGRQPAPAALELLAALVETPSHNDQVRNAAISALSERDEVERCLELVLPYAEAPTPWRVRSGALRAVGRLARRKAMPEARRDEVIDLLAGMLEEPSERFRRDAANALRAIGAHAATTEKALQVLADADPDQSVKDAAKAALGAVRKGTPPDEEIARLRAELERTLAEGAKLRERLERVEARLDGEGEGKAVPAEKVPY